MPTSDSVGFLPRDTRMGRMGRGFSVIIEIEDFWCENLIPAYLYPYFKPVGLRALSKSRCKSGCNVWILLQVPYVYKLDVSITEASGIGIRI